MPQWEDPSAPLQLARKKHRRLALLLGGIAMSFAAGALVAAGALGVRAGGHADATPVTREHKSAVVEIPAKHIVGDPGAFGGDDGGATATRGYKSIVIKVPVQHIVGRLAAPIKSMRGARAVSRRMSVRSETQPNTRDQAEAKRLAVEGAAVGEQSVPAASPELPERPTRQQVSEGLEALRPALNACAAGAHGTMSADITIAGSGRVTYSMVGGDFAGTRAGTCMARTLRGAALPAFAGRSFKVRYPFVI